MMSRKVFDFSVDRQGCLKNAIVGHTLCEAAKLGAKKTDRKILKRDDNLKKHTSILRYEVNYDYHYSTVMIVGS